MFREFLKAESGATTVDYAVIVALVVLGTFMYIKAFENGLIHVVFIFSAIILISPVIWLLPKFIKKLDAKKYEKQKEQENLPKHEELRTTKRTLITASGAIPSHFQAEKSAEMMMSEKPIYDALGHVWDGLKLEIDNLNDRFTTLEPRVKHSINEEPRDIEDYHSDERVRREYEDLKEDLIEVTKRCRQFFMIDKLDWTEDLLPTTQVSRYLAIIEETPSLEKTVKTLKHEQHALLFRIKRLKNKIKLKRTGAQLSELEEEQRKLIEKRRAITTELHPMENKIRELEKEKMTLTTSFLESLVPFETVPDNPSSDVTF